MIEITDAPRETRSRDPSRRARDPGHSLPWPSFTRSFVIAGEDVVDRVETTDGSEVILNMAIMHAQLEVVRELALPPSLDVNLDPVRNYGLAKTKCPFCPGTPVACIYTVYRYRSFAEY